MTNPYNYGKKLLTEMRELMRRLHYSIHTERAYCDWVERFVRFHHMQTREALFVEAERKSEEFLTHLAVKGKVSASTQSQAFNALIFWGIRFGPVGQRITWANTSLISHRQSVIEQLRESGKYRGTGIGRYVVINSWKI